MPLVYFVNSLGRRQVCTGPVLGYRVRIQQTVLLILLVETPTEPACSGRLKLTHRLPENTGLT